LIQGELEQQAKEYEGQAKSAEQEAASAYLGCNPEEPCGAVEEDEKRAKADIAAASAAEKMANAEGVAAAKHETEASSTRLK
jgi:bifunctional pyridoxal-dependent enzyme with beta-cystathionase and maltose regulon repressor activities